MAQQLDLLGGSFVKTDTRNIGLRPVHASNQAQIDGITMLGCQRWTSATCEDHGYLSADKIINCEFTLPLGYHTQPAIFNFYVLPFNIPNLHQAFRDRR
jgi:hypothetical protein